LQQTLDPEMQAESLNRFKQELKLSRKYRRELERKIGRPL